jgi:uncharacterized protein (TIGR03086 family)
MAAGVCSVVTTTIDLEPACRRLAAMVAAVPDDALDRPTPCSEYSVADLLDHISGFLVAFVAAARKAPLDGAPSADGTSLAPDWRTRIPQEVDALAEAWRDPDAWTGMTAAGGVDLPGEVAGAVALDELVLHAWDLAAATGQPAAFDGPELEHVHQMVLQFKDAGIFGPEVAIAADAALFDRILGLSGRDPGWQPPA